jgi:hypothetical protein
MDTNEFWTIIEAADGTPGRLHATLAELPRDRLVAFERIHQEQIDRAYTWDLWGAGYLRFGGMGDDAFEYFRAYLISRGRTVFEAAVRDPDALADVELDDGEEWEDWMSPTMEVIHRETGEYDFADPRPRTDAPTEPSGTPWDEDELPARYPRIARAFG